MKVTFMQQLLSESSFMPQLISESLWAVYVCNKHTDRTQK